MQFVKKTSSRSTIIKLILKLTLFIFLLIGGIFLLNQIDFPAPKNEIEKIIPNENLKIIK